MAIEKQIIADVAVVTEQAGLSSRLFDYLQTLKADASRRSNREKVLSHAGAIKDDEAAEMMNIIQTEFGKPDAEWH